MSSEIMDFKTTARYLCVSESKLYKMTHKREIAFMKIGRLNMFRRVELDKFLEDNRVPPKWELTNVAKFMH